jgi:hypothetical protein
VIALLALLLSLAGFTSLALAMDRHHRQLRGRPLGDGHGRRLRLVGGLSLALSYGCVVADMGWALGSLAWFGFLSLGAAAVLLRLSANENAR